MPVGAAKSLPFNLLPSILPAYGALRISQVPESLTQFTVSPEKRGKIFSGNFCYGNLM
jgi:hypothetical protein